MNQGVSNWNMESNLPLLETQKRSMGVNNELVELLWKHGQVFKNSQTHRKVGETGQRSKNDHAIRDGESFVNSSSLVEDDVMASWMQCPLDDSLGGDFLSGLFYEPPNSHPVEKEKPFKHFGALEEASVLDANNAVRLQQPVLRQPNNFSLVETSVGLNVASLTQVPSFGGLDKIENFPHFSRPARAEIGSSNAPMRGSGLGVLTGRDIGECSVMTVGSSDCGSNQITQGIDRSRVSTNRLGSTGTRKNGPDVSLQREMGLTETLDTAITSSSGGSGGSYTETDKQSVSVKEHKRKGRDGNESELQSEGADFESAGAKKAPRQSGSTRRSRAAEVHNLSERRRRDRINEKMKALQELIPHCNKSDKASMLDEAIEYLKSLQLQVQMMWMGGGMAPMMLPSVQNYISRMSMGMQTHQALPSIHGPVQLPRLPLVTRSMSPAPFSNQPTVFPSVLNGVNLQNRMQNPNFSLPYMGFPQMQTPQSMNIYGYGSQISQPSSKIAAPCHAKIPTDNTPRTK